jgi:hypothetical protein
MNIYVNLVIATTGANPPDPPAEDGPLRKTPGQLIAGSG